MASTLLLDDFNERSKMTEKKYKQKLRSLIGGDSYQDAVDDMVEAEGGKLTNTVSHQGKSPEKYQQDVDRMVERGAQLRKRQSKKDNDKMLKEGDPRQTYAEGSLMMPEEGMPVDTYDNIPPEEMDEAMASQLPDDEMEDEYLNYVIGESLDDSEQQYLAQALQNDPQLGNILDKVMTVASEFSGAGEVEGPGTGVSDSIPARLSDGEFVITKKATDQIGAENLQTLMDDAERAYDGGYQMKAIGGYMEEDPEKQDSPLSKTDEEIKKLMMGANKMPSLR